MVILKNLHKLRVRVRKCYITHISFRTGIKMLYPYSGYLWHRRTELAEVPGTGMKYRTYTSSGYGYECPTELTEVLRRVIPGVNTPGMVLYVPYRTQHWNILFK